ncbi:ArdC family protein [Mucilaginibacter sp.]
MATYTKRPSTKRTNNTATYKDTYQEGTDAVIKALEEGTVIWQCSWNQAGLPKNITTGIEYRGWNIFWLNFHTMLNGYATPYYLTYKQAQALGGNIRKGEKGTRIVYWATIESKRKGDDSDTNATTNSNTTADTDALQVKPSTKLVPKAHTVFNIAQTEGIAFDLPSLTSKSKNEQILACEQVIADMPNPPKINCNGSKAYYISSTDTVVIPNLTNSITAEEYYSTFYHELAHSTGHTSRLNRKEMIEGTYGSSNYAKEELTAEMTSAFLCAITNIGLPTLANSAAYLQGWLKALRNDKTLILKAAAQAQRACDYILNVNYEAS